MDLGLQKIKSLRDFSEDESVFETFDFFDLYRIGKSLISLEKNRIKKALRNTPFENVDNEYFLGAWWGSFLENSDFDIPKTKAYGAGLHSKEVLSLSAYEFWKNEVSTFKSCIPFINQFFDTYIDLKDGGKLHDEFYLNYDVDNIDFESILISSFVNFSLGHFSGTDVNKMGVTLSELKSFFTEFFSKKDEEYVLLDSSEDKMKEILELFLGKFGFAQIIGFEKYLYGILAEHLSGYEFDSLDDEDFKHIGGPILLNNTKN